MNCTDSTESDAALSELIAKYHEGAAYQIAQVYAFRNQSDKAFEWLDRTPPIDAVACQGPLSIPQ
jgi:hypothetical protein